jgi:hypothetical protein
MWRSGSFTPIKCSSAEERDDMEPNTESHADILLQEQIRACEVHRANFCANSVRFDDASDSLFEYLGDMLRARKLEG